MAREYPSQPIVGVGAVVLRAGTAGWEVLLVRRGHAPAQGEWSIPGGGVELGETLEEAVVREVWEETGLEVAAAGVVEVLDQITLDPAGDKVRYHYVLIDFACTVVGGTLGAASDAMDACWQAIESLGEEGEFALRAKTIAVIRKAYAGISAQGNWLK